ncbi:zinc-dependent alcohol dehydrogenase family protein [Cellulosimicrobium cellulans]|uniref:alcohol dehydrogenase n=1 Tax=Cellulosimicrobium funkei TaxID=264251 RepID=A0A0H2KR67_9MICO|nr:zinc-dependent alcohol dehydrogenase family protein [Cellulosimicrobium funkei]KLN34344.1 alcohol dehydrogenase [Cellulosimicrobium funkei]
MRAWRAGEHPGELRLVDEHAPVPASHEVSVSVEACGVCRTDLHVIDQELPVHRPGVVPGHQVVGTVARAGAEVHHLRPGDRVGVAWLHQTCGQCSWCRTGRENLCPDSRYTGWDVDGGFSEYVTAPAAYVYPLPDEADAPATAPLLCAGIIGYRALTRANLPPGGNLGIYGFGSSAHITAQIAIASGARVFAMTRGEANRDLARHLGATFVTDATGAPSEPLDAAIVFAPAGELVPVALSATTRGGTVVLAGIHMSDVPVLDYHHHLFNERDLRTVTANTRADGAALLRLAAALRITPTVTTYPLDQAPDALEELRSGRASGSLVLVPG